jgi:solute carrier family 25 (mitochondrial carnitine/acylcarnitine transporter), member 20/29
MSTATAPAPPPSAGKILFNRIFSVSAWVEDAGSFALDALAGSIGSAAGVFVGSPFDVIKTRQQRLGGSASAMQIAKSMLKAEGPASFFRGAVVSAVGCVPNNAVTFGVAGWSTKTMNLINPVPEEKGLSFINIFAAGSWAGFSQSIVLAPFEHVKVQQMMATGKASAAPSFLSTSREIARKAGFARGIMRGWVATALRDGPTFGFYFLSFDLCKWLWMKKNEAKKPEPHTVHELGEEASLLLHTQAPNVPTWVVLSGGALAGITSWSGE